MTPQKRMETGSVIQTVEREKNAAELVHDLQRKGAVLQKRRYGKAVLVDLCNGSDISLRLTETVDTGWVGKPKGLHQVLYERGFLDPDKLGTYTKNGRKNVDFDADGNLTEEGKKVAMVHLMSNCSDFKEEKSDLEYLCNDISAMSSGTYQMFFTPKYHCEMAGEGIEYSWGISKRWYRKLPLEEKRTKEKFEQCVRRAVSQVTVDNVRACSRKARRYMMCYHFYKLNGDKIAPGYEDIERIQKTFKGHRDALNIDLAFIIKTMQSAIRQEEE